jgi:hypothetical protein
MAWCSVKHWDSFIVLLTGDRGTHITLRGFPQGIVTCNTEYYKEDEEKPLLLFEVMHMAPHFSPVKQFICFVFVGIPHSFSAESNEIPCYHKE